MNIKENNRLKAQEELQSQLDRYFKSDSKDGHTMTISPRSYIFRPWITVHGFKIKEFNYAN